MDISLSPFRSSKLSAPYAWKQVACRPPKITTFGRRRQLSAHLANSTQIFSATNFQPRGVVNCLAIPPNENNKRRTTTVQASKSDSVVEKIVNFSDVMGRFLRIRVPRGTVIGFTAILARTMIDHSTLLNWSQLLKAFAGLVAMLCVDGYVVGINQIFDIDVDKINKPNLPLASGDLSLDSAWLLMISFVAVGIVAGGSLNSSAFAFSIYFNLILGTVYSVPPIRMKSRSPLTNILLLVLRRGCCLVLGASLAAKASLGLPFIMSPHIIFMTIFASLYAASFAFLKDLSDVEGDRKCNIPTLARIFGVRNVAIFGCVLLLTSYIGALSAAIYLPQDFKRSIMIPTHTVLALCLIFQGWKLHKANYEKEECLVFYEFLWKLKDAAFVEAISAFYRFIWNLFYAEYALFPFI